MADGKLQSTQKMLSPIRRQSKIGIHQKSANIFEENFFAELIEREEQEMLKGITKGREPMDDDDFFEEHFAKKENYPSKQKLIKPMMNNEKRINKRREPSGQRREPVSQGRENFGQRRVSVGQRKEPMGDDFFEEHFARKGNYSSKQKLIKREEKPMMNNVNMKRINQRREPIGQRREPVVQRKEPIVGVISQEHFAKKGYSSNQKLIKPTMNNNVKEIGQRRESIGQKSESMSDFFEEYFTKEGDHSSEQQKLIEMVGEDGFDLLNEEKGPQGIKKLWNQIDPIWKWSQEELVEFMAKRVIYETDDLIALDKPFQMALCFAPPGRQQMDGILFALRDKIVPGKRLYMVTRLDKAASGVILFAKNKEKKDELIELFEQDHFYFRYRCLCRNFPKEVKTRINIPLIKVRKNIQKSENVKFCPLIGEARSTEQVYKYNTDCKLVNENRPAMVSLIDVFTRRGMCNLVRSHLYYGLDCPVIGDEKYARSAKPGEFILKKAIHSEAMAALELRKNDVKKLPMFMHLAELHIPKRRYQTNGKFMDYTAIKAPMPNYFLYALKKLSLLSKFK